MARLKSDFDVRILSPKDLTRRDLAVWAEIQKREPAFSNPLFSPEFAAAVARVREDVAVAVFSHRGRPEAFLAHHRRPSGFGRPIGAPFCDYHGLVALPGEGPAGSDALRLAGLSAFRHSGLVDPDDAFAGLEGGPQAYAITLTEGPDAYLEAVRSASPKKFKNYRRLRHRLEQDFGPLALRASRSQGDLDRILAWKRDQFVRTGVQDVLRPEWASRLMQSLFETETPTFAGLMLTLHAGETLVGGHFGVRAGDIYHPWIASTAPDLAALSPGQAFLDQAIGAMPGLGLRVYDLGPGHDHYKAPFASSSQTLKAGLSSVSSLRGRLSAAGERSWRLGGSSSALDKVRRRLDHIATADPSLRGRLCGVIEAARATRHRGFSRPVEH